MGYTIFIHDLCTTKLQVRCINLAAQKLVDSSSACKDDRLTFNLNCSLAQTDKISTDP